MDVPFHLNFLAYQSKYGVNVACGAAGEDGFARLVTGPGPGSWNGAVVKIWEYREAQVHLQGNFRAFNYRYGVIPAIHTFWY